MMSPKFCFQITLFLSPRMKRYSQYIFLDQKKKIMGNIIKYGEISWYYIVDWSSFSDDTNRKLLLEQSDSRPRDRPRDPTGNYHSTIFCLLVYCVYCEGTEQQKCCSSLLQENIVRRTQKLTWGRDYKKQKLLLLLLALAGSLVNSITTIIGVGPGRN